MPDERQKVTLLPFVMKSLYTALCPFGFQDVAWKWSFLCYYQQITIAITCDVPQGSLFGPLLFSLCKVSFYSTVFYTNPVSNHSFAKILVFVP